ncbi:NADH:flavin oxidoreductase [Robertkochia sp. 1368]|nr:NADH:flavin oxidoreductase [Robertkochia sediminum]
MLAPLTNMQSHEDGTLSGDEKHWLTMRAKGQFGLVMTCAALVQFNGKCWSGQLGIYSDGHIEGLRSLANDLRNEGSLSVVQLHHGGMRSYAALAGEMSVCPSENVEHDARAMTLEEVEETRDHFIAAAVRAKNSGFDGVEVHGAHGYLVAQFLSAETNQRTDRYGGNLENRSRLLFEIIDGIREACGSDFLLGVRLSPERFGMELAEVKELCGILVAKGQVDFLDISLWDVFKTPEGSEEDGKLLLDHFTEMDRKGVKLTVAGKIYGGKEVHKVLDAGVDFVTVGRSGILHHDFPEKVMTNPGFKSTEIPVASDYLRSEGLGESFIKYMQRWKGFVED